MTVMGPGGSGNRKDPRPPRVPDVDPLRRSFDSGFFPLVPGLRIPLNIYIPLESTVGFDFS